jgi:putative inorganic carbon (HCO3(-)) transporter
VNSQVRVVRAQRAGIAGLVVVNGALFWRTPVDLFSLPRATAIAVAVMAIAALSMIRWLQEGPARQSHSSLTRLCAVFVAAVVLAVSVSDEPVRSVVGPYSRYTGLAMQVTYVALLLLVVRLYDRDSVRQLASASLAALAVVAAYGVVQYAGLDPLDWPQPEHLVVQFGRFDTDFSTLGNIDFAAAFVGITAPFALWAGLSRSGAFWRRAVGAAVLTGAIAYLAGNEAFQGPVTMVAGCAVVAGAWLSDRRETWSGLSRLSRHFIVGLAGVVLVAVLAIAPVVMSRTVGELGEAEERVQFWQTAGEMWLEEPVFGHGLGAFGREFMARRPPDHAVERGFQTADAPHNVLMEHLAGGGVLLAGSYLAIVGFTGLALLRGLRQTTGEARLLLGAFGGSWLAYQIQSLVSIDVPAIALLHWATAGGIVVIALSPETRLHIAPASGDLTPWRRTLMPLAVAVIGIAAIWFATQPLRADIEAGQARDSRRPGQYETSARHARRATELAPWEGSYWALLAGALDRMGDLPAAYDAGSRAAREDSWNSSYALAAAGIAERRGSVDDALFWLDEALERDPHNPAVLQTTARFNLESGSPRRARSVLEHAVAVDPTSAETWGLLGAAYETLGDEQSARQAYERALDLDAGNRQAQEGIERLS